MVGNSGKMLRQQKKDVAKPMIVPLVEGSTPTVLEHIPRLNTGTHSAIRIMEEGQTSKNTSRGRLKVGNNLHKGVQTKKRSDNKMVVSNVVEWVKSAQAQVDLIAATPVIVSDGRMENRQSSNNPIAILDHDGIGDGSMIGDKLDAEVNPPGKGGHEW
ncbi:hypothetical protein GQ457_06G017570 [Hibiscus cannabinus]